MTSPPAAADVAGLAALRPAMEDLLIRFAAVDSATSDPPGLAAMRDALCAELAHLPCDVVTVPTGPNGEATILAAARPDAPRRVLLSGHYDTVFGPETGEFPVTRLDADTLRGPGVIDMKGGIVVMLHALRRLEDSPYAPGLGWEVILVPDEETGSPHSASLIAEAASRAHVGLVFEPALPVGGIVRHRLGSGWFRLTATGIAAHSGRDFAAGRNALVAVAAAATAVHELNAHDDVIVNVARIDGGGAANVVPDHAVLDIGVRAATDDAAQFIETRIRDIAAAAARGHDVTVTVDGRFTRPPRRVDGRWEPLASAYVAAAADLGVSIGWADAAGSSDANLLTAAGLPTLDGLGPRGGGMHSRDEHCALPSLPERAAVAALFLMRLAAGEVPVPQRTG
ncbi:MAG: hydrolase [Actinomycetota bacterium]